MQLRVNKIKINIEELFIIIIFTIIFSPIIRSYLFNYIVCYLFIVFHESAHVFVASILGIEIACINIKVSGLNAELKIKNKINTKLLPIYLAGPISNIVLAIIFKNVQMVRDINIALAIINILPIYPLDGFNIINLILLYLLPIRKIKVSLKIIQIICFGIMLILGICILIIYKNVSILILMIYILELNVNKNNM